jgi:hypothetical protein
MDTLELPDDLYIAERIVLAEADRLTAALNEKGHTGSVSLWFAFPNEHAPDRRVVASFDGGRIFQSTRGATLAEAIANAEEIIAKLPQRDPRSEALAEFQKARAALVAAGVDPAEAA